MGVVLLHVLQWILRIILFLLLLLLILTVIVLLVPIRYQAEGVFCEKKPEAKGKITWFFYLIYMSFVYEDDFNMQVRVFGFKVFDTEREVPQRKQEQTQNIVGESAESTWENRQTDNTVKSMVEDRTTNKDVEGALEEIPADEGIESTIDEIISDEIADEKIIGCEEETETQNSDLQQAGQGERNSFKEENQDTTKKEKEKKSFSEKIENVKLKIQEIIQKIKDIWGKIREGKLKAEHYLELWNRKETQITFQRAKTKLGKMIKAVLPRKWKVAGEVGFDNPCTTGQLMGVLGALYPILGNKVQIVPNFENKVIDIQGNVKGHIRLGNLLYQVVSLLLNRHCFKLIKIIFDELGGSKKKEKET